VGMKDPYNPKNPHAGQKKKKKGEKTKLRGVVSSAAGRMQPNN